MATRSARLGRILRASLAPDPDPEKLGRLVAGQDLSGLVEAAGYHRVVSFVYRAVKDLERVDEATRSRLERFYRQALVVHLRVIGVLKQASAALEPLNLPWVVVKGPALAELAYRRSGLRLYQDLDLVVSRAGFAEAVSALEGAGFRLLDRNWNLMRRLMIGELVFSPEGGPEVDLHWDLRYDAELRRLLTVSTDELLARARPVVLGGVETSTFDPTDTLIYLARHGCKQGGYRLIWLKDLERSIANDSPDWDLVVRRSTEWGVNLFVGAMLLRSRRVVQAAVPDEVVRALLPSSVWRGTLATLDRLFPVERSSGFGSPATLVVRSTRPDVRSTLAVAMRGASSRLSRLVRLGRAERDTAQDDPDDPASRAFPTGGPGARERYLAEVMLEP
jgi:hypothetical protein